MTYSKDMKPYIIHAMDCENLVELRTFNGYIGDMMLQLTFSNHNDLDTIINWCEYNNQEYKSRYQANLGLWYIFIPFTRDDIYHLKDYKK